MKSFQVLSTSSQEKIIGGGGSQSRPVVVVDGLRVEAGWEHGRYRITGSPTGVSLNVNIAHGLGRKR